MNATSKKLRQERAEICDRAKVITAKSNPSADEIQAFERLMKQADDLKAAIDRAERISELDDELSAKYRPNSQAMFSLGGEPGNSGDLSFRDRKTGERIRALRPNEKFSDMYRPAIGRDASLGDVVSAMAVPVSGSLEVRNLLSEGSGPGGGYTVPESLSATVIDALRAKTACLQLGAVTIPMSTPDLHFARLTGDATASWRTENQTIDESTPSFGRETLSAKSLATIVRFSRELAEDSINLDAILRQTLSAAFAIELDRALMFGDGATEPMGIVNRTNVGSVSLGADGAVLTPDDMIDAIYELELDNAGPATGAIMHPRTWRTIAKWKSGDGEPLILNPTVTALPKISTTSVPINQTVGMSTDCSSVIVGDFSQLFVGIRTQLSLQILNERYASDGQLAMLAWLRADAAVAHDESFAVISGVRA